jgi:hypothetical protein
MSKRTFIPAAAAVISAFVVAVPVTGASAANGPVTAATNAEQVGAAAAVSGWQAGAAAAASGWQAGANALAPLLAPGSGMFGLASFPGFVNLGPTGPLGPLGAHGPLGSNANLPTGWNAWNLGPSGPLGPGGVLG